MTHFGNELNNGPVEGASNEMPRCATCGHAYESHNLKTDRCRECPCPWYSRSKS